MLFINMRLLLLLLVLWLVLASAKVHKLDAEDEHTAYTVATRDKVKMSCRGQWYKNDHQLAQSLGKIRITKRMLTIQDVSMSDSGQYNCLLSDGTGWKNVTLYVMQAKPSNLIQEPGPPKIRKVNSINSLRLRPAGNSIHLRCPAEGYPEPNITWYKDGSLLARRDGEVTRKGWALILQDLLPQQDTGNYTCVLSNQYGSVNFTYLLEVQERYPHKPIMRNTMINQTIFLNTRALLNCSFISEDMPEIRWYKSQFNYLNKRETSVGLSSDNRTSLEFHSTASGTEYSTLVMTNVTLNDSAWYHCEVSNSLGTSVAGAYLNVVEVDDEIGGCWYKKGGVEYSIMNKDILTHISPQQFLKLRTASTTKTLTHQVKSLKKKLLWTQRKYRVLKKIHSSCNKKLRGFL